MFSSRSLWVASLISGLAAAPAHAAQLPAQTAAYAAVQTIEMAGGGAMSATIYRAGEKMRMENAMGMTMILEPEKNRMVMLLPGSGMAMAMPLDPAQQVNRSEALAHCAITAGGRETLDGEATTLYALDCPQTPTTEPWKGEIAMTADGIPMRAVMQVRDNGRTVEVVSRLSAVKRGPQDAALFTVPPGTRITEGMPQIPGMPPMAR